MEREMIYYFMAYNAVTGEMERAPRPATLEGITHTKGEALLDTGFEVEKPELDGNGFWNGPKQA